MIRVPRGTVKAPASLAAAGVEERRKAVAHYGKPENKETTFSFTAYKGADVVQTLNELFHHKCAYCESSYKATSPADIEHFRPKGAIVIRGADGEKDKREKPGYYWLAATWENLLASCPDCNRARTHLFQDPGEDEETPGVRGKENKFPLIDETRRVRTPPASGEGTEAGQRLLIDPCRDRPEAHLEFHPDGLVWARRSGSSVSRKGRESIVAYGLTRKELKEARRAHLLDVARKMRAMLFHIDALDQDPGNAASEAEFRILLEELRGMTAADSPYAGMTRQYVRDFEASIRSRTARDFVTVLLTQVTAPPTTPS